MRSLFDIIDRSLSSANALAVAIVVLQLSLFCMGFCGSNDSFVNPVSRHGATQVIHGQSLPTDRPLTPSPLLPAHVAADFVEDEVESEDPFGPRFSITWQPVKRADARVAGLGLFHRASVTALLARAADYGVLCRRLL